MSEVGAEALLVCMAAEGDDKHGNLGLGGNDTREIDTREIVVYFTCTQPEVADKEFHVYPTRACRLP